MSAGVGFKSEKSSAKKNRILMKSCHYEVSQDQEASPKQKYPFQDQKIL